MSTDLADLDRLIAPHAIALRTRKSQLWTVVPASRIPDGNLPLGLQLLLYKPDASRISDPAVTPKSRNRFRSMWVPSLSPNVGIVTALVILIVAIVAAINGNSISMRTSRAINSGSELLISFVSATIFWFLYPIISAMLASSELGKNTRCLYLLPWPKLESVIWRLGIKGKTALTCLLIPFSIEVASLLAFGVYPPIMLGAGTASAVFLVMATFPLNPSPGARLLERLSGINDLSRQMNWMVLSKFITLRLEKFDRISLVAISLVGYLLGWLGGTISLIWVIMTFPVSADAHLQFGWQVALLVVIVTYFFRLFMQLLKLLFTSLRSTGGMALEVVSPPEDLVIRWKTQSALLRHVPRLQDAHWQWNSVHAGSYLIREGQHDRRFYWLTSGRAVVLIPDDLGTPTHVATLGAGTGVGEIALLDNRPRTADVVVQETALIASLSAEAFSDIATDEIRNRFREVILAGQSLARASVFYGMPDPDRERWIAYGTPRHFDPGDAIILEGSDQQWIGLAVQGTIAVERGEDTIAELPVDSVFGEIAYLTTGIRTATLRALEPTLIWRWDPDWLDIELDRAGILGALRELATTRT